MSTPLFRTVSSQEWILTERRTRTNAQHLDIYQALNHLQQHPDALVKVRIRSSARRHKKQHTVLVYAERRKMKISTMADYRRGWLYIRNAATPVPEIGPGFENTDPREWQNARATRKKPPQTDPADKLLALVEPRKKQVSL